MERVAFSPVTDGSDWHDPENQARDGKGCWVCHVNPPVVWLDLRDGWDRFGVRFTGRPYALCLECLGRWFPGWGAERVLDWLVCQTERGVAWKQGAEARVKRNEESLREWMKG